MNKVRVRFAPSPTGFLHVGGLRTALFNFLWAKKNKGVFILRIEDTDKSREVAGAAQNIQDTLKKFNLDWDEGPYFQSQRLDIYKKYINVLLVKGAAYRCYCPAERIAELKKEAELQKMPFKYDKHCLKNPSNGAGNIKFVIRQNVPEEGFTEFNDLVYGPIKIENRLLDDGVLIKSDSFPVYNFANVVDDYLMQITHVIRGEEFVSSTPKHVLLYQAFGWALPQFVHLPLLLDKERKKLSKRSGDVAVQEYLEKGYQPGAILNFVAFLGWNPKTEQEIFSLEELVKAFDLSKINKAGSIFDLEKLKWFDKHYLKETPSEELVEPSKPYLDVDLPDEFIAKILEIEKGRMVNLEEVGERARYFFHEPEYDKNLLRWKKMTDMEIIISLNSSKKIISNFPDTILEQDIKNAFFKEIGERDKGEMLWPLRVALTGLKASPSPFEIMEAFFILPNGKEIVLERIEKAIEKLGNP
jgi:glutamyl-tRNA synthetase